MEYFGFASGSSATGPAFPYMPESVLNNYPNTLLEHPALPTSTGGLLNLNIIDPPDARTLLTAMQVWTERSVSLIDKQTLRAVGLGLSASLFVYGAWKISRRWNDNIDAFNGVPEIYHDAKPFLCGEEMDIDLDTLQKQLLDTRGKLEDLRYQMTQVDDEKDMLAAEVSMRKKIVATLQEEIHTERDKRQQAELKMEMMEWENLHLRQMRKDFVAKESKIDMLEASLKEKDALHDKLFQENVILPKNIATARAKEYESLRAKVKRYEMNAAFTRNSETPYKPGSGQRPLQLSTESDQQRIVDSSTPTLETANESSEWENSVGMSGDSIFPQSFFFRARNMTSSNRSTTAEKRSKSLATSDAFPEGTLRAMQDRCRSVEGRIESADMSLEEKESLINEKYGVNAGDSVKSTTTINSVTDKVMSPSNANRKRKDVSSIDRPSQDEDNSCVLGRFRSFFGGVNISSGSDCRLVTTPECSTSPAQMGEVLLSQSRLWETANNCCHLESSHEKETEQLEDEDNCASVSDCHSSIFMSASCGSESSEDEGTTASRVPRNKSSNRIRSKRRSRSVKDRSHKIVSSVKNLNHEQDVRGSPTKAERCKNSTSRPREEKSPVSPSLNETPFSILTMASARDVSFSKASICQSVSTFDPSVPQTGRARSRYRPRKSRSKMTNLGVDSHIEASPADKPNKKAVFSIPASYSNNIPLCAAKGDISLHHSIQNTERLNNCLNNVNKNRVDHTDSESEKSWIVISPSK